MAVTDSAFKAVMPYVVIAALIGGAVVFRKQIADWLKGLLPAPGDVVETVTEAPGKAWAYLNTDDYCSKNPNAIQCLWKKWFPKESTVDERWQAWKESGATTDILDIPGIVIAPASWLPGSDQAQPAAPGPSPAAQALGLTGNPITGYSSVMAPLTDPIGGLPADQGIQPGRYYQGDMMLEVTEHSLGVFRADARYAGLGNEGWANVWYGGGDAKYNATGIKWLETFGLA